MKRCMFRGCDNAVVSRCFSDRPTSPLVVCFTHERELVDRYGYADVWPQTIVRWPQDVLSAVRYLQEDTV